MAEPLPPFRILAPTAILGYGFPVDSFMEGLRREPDLIAVDAGSTDPGPYYLGAGTSFTDERAVHRDLHHILREAVPRGIPVVIGSAGGSGAAPHLKWCGRIVRQVAKENNLSFLLGEIAADLPELFVLDALRKGRASPLSGAPELTEQSVKETTHIVAQMGTSPIIDAHRKDCDVILAGRAYDPAPFAALPILRGYPPGLALHLGKILECGAIAANPGSGSDCAMGVLEENRFTLVSLSDERTFTRQSVAAHSLYEKADPYHLHGPGGHLDLENTVFEEMDAAGTRVRGTRFVECSPFAIKVEGARKVGYRTIAIAGIRDPGLIHQVNSVLDEVQNRVKRTARSEGIGGELNFHIYGKNGVMGELEPEVDNVGHELGLVIESVAEREEDAHSLCSITRSTLLHYGYTDRIATAGNLALPFSPSEIDAGEVYEFSIYHLIECAEQDLFQTRVIEI